MSTRVHCMSNWLFAISIPVVARGHVHLTETLWP